MKKKFLAMALGIAVVLSCTACGGGSSDAAAPASGETMLLLQKPEAIQQQAEAQQ